ncbi:MAG: T9SS type A sorting domain-containing protein [Cytophagales bacterium]
MNLNIKILLISYFLMFNFHIKAQNQPFDIIDSWNIYDSVGEKYIDDFIYFNNKLWTISSSSDDSIFILNANGSFDSGIKINGLSNIRAISNDDQYIYLSTLFKISKIDPNSKSIISQINIPQVGYNLCFDPNADSGNGGFWIDGINNYFNLVNMNGILIDSIPIPNSQYTSSNDLILDTLTFNNPHLIYHHAGPGGTNLLSWVNISTKSSTLFSLNIGSITGHNCYYSASALITNLNIPSNSYSQIISLQGRPVDSIQILTIFNLDTPESPISPLNDNICNSRKIQIDSGYFFFDNFNSTSEPNEPTGTCFSTPVDSTVWFKIPVSSPAFAISNNDTNCYTSRYEFAVYNSLNGCNGPFTQIGCGTPGPWGGFDRAYIYGQTLGDTVWVQADGNFIPDYLAIRAFSVPSISRDFEYYSDGKFIALYDDEWNVSNGLNIAQTGEDAQVTDTVSNSGSYSLKIDSTSELVYDLYQIDSSEHVIGFEMYIPSGKEAYFELHGADSSIITRTSFNFSNQGIDSLSGINFLYPNDTWFNVEYYVDLELNRIQFWVANLFVYQVAIPNLDSIGIGYFDFSPAGASTTTRLFYLDDMLNAEFTFPVVPGSQLSAFNLKSPNNNANLVIDNGTLHNNVFTWDSTFDSFGSNVEYKLVFYLDSANLLVEKLSLNSANDTLLTMSEPLIDSLYQILGKNTMDTLNLKWDVLAETNLNNANSSNGPFEISIYRGTYVGLEINDQIHQIRLFPNPNKGELYLESSLSEFELKIYDLNGRLQFQERIKSANKKLDIHLLQSGLYLIRIDSDTNSWTRKLFLDK